MKSDIRLGKIAGIPIGMSWSLLLIAGLLTWMLATSALPLQAPGFGTGSYVAAALIGAALFFGSILLHEVGHALVAKHYGMRVESITLWLLGGVARMRDEAPRPRAEALMALAGPGVSFVLAAVFAGASIAVSTLATTPTTAVLAWLAFVNALLAVFNLIPGAPLDGGRVLRAAIWAAKKDRDRAGVAAARAGRFVGFGFGALGLALTFATGSFGGIWFVLVGLFIVTAAGAEQRYYRMRAGLRSARVRDALSGGPGVVPGWYSVEEAISGGYVPSQWHTLAVESYGGGAQGVFTSAALTAVPFAARAHTRVQDVAVSAPSITCELDDKLVDVVAELAEAQATFAIVVAGDQPTGALSLADIDRIAEHWSQSYRAQPTPHGRIGPNNAHAPRGAA